MKYLCYFLQINLNSPIAFFITARSELWKVLFLALSLSVLWTFAPTRWLVSSRCGKFTCQSHWCCAGVTHCSPPQLPRKISAFVTTRGDGSRVGYPTLHLSTCISQRPHVRTSWNFPVHAVAMAQSCDHSALCYVLLFYEAIGKLFTVTHQVEPGMKSALDDCLVFSSKYVCLYNSAVCHFGRFSRHLSVNQIELYKQILHSW